MKNMKNIIAIILNLFLLSACTTISGVGEDNTPAPSKLMDYTPQIKPELLWEKKIESSKTVSVFDFSNGMVFWNSKLKENLAAGPAISIANNLVVAGDDKAGLWAFDLNNGETMWHITLSDPIVAPPIIAGNKLFVRTLDGTVWGINNINGSVIWQSSHNTPLMILSGGSKPVLINNNIIVGSSDGTLTAYAAENGKIKWHVSIARPQGVADVEKMVDIVANPKLSGNMIYIVTYQGNLAAVNAETGRINWQRPLSSYTGLTVSENAIFITDTQSDVWAFSRSTGQEIWHQDYLKYRHLTAPAVDNKNKAIIIGDDEGYVHWLSQSTGKTIARIKTSRSGITDSPKIQNNIIYILSNNGLVSAYAN